MKFKYISFQINCVHYWKDFKIKLEFFSFKQNPNKISNSKNDIFCKFLNEIR
jgi:hypothetical protein